MEHTSWDFFIHVTEASHSPSSELSRLNIHLLPFRLNTPKGELNSILTSSETRRIIWNYAIREGQGLFQTQCQGIEENKCMPFYFTNSRQDVDRHGTE
jgi:hypothetical protein